LPHRNLLNRQSSRNSFPSGLRLRHCRSRLDADPRRIHRAAQFKTPRRRASLGFALPQIRLRDRDFRLLAKAERTRKLHFPLRTFQANSLEIHGAVLHRNLSSPLIHRDTPRRGAPASRLPATSQPRNSTLLAFISPLPSSSCSNSSRPTPFVVNRSVPFAVPAQRSVQCAAHGTCARFTPSNPAAISYFGDAENTAVIP